MFALAILTLRETDRRRPIVAGGKVIAHISPEPPISDDRNDYKTMTILVSNFNNFRWVDRSS